MSKKILLSISFLLLSVFLVAGCAKKTANIEKIDFDIYAMSQCPYGSEAEKLVYQIKKDFEDYVNFNVEYIVEENTDGTFKSLHGEPEVVGNKYQLCVKAKYPDKFWDYLECQNKNYQDLAGSFESCANENSLDFTSLKTCAEGEEGVSLLRASSEKSKTAEATGSPTFVIKGERYMGARTNIAMQRRLCSALDNKAKICKSLPEDKEVTAYLLTDKRCVKPECDTTSLKEQLKNAFPKIAFNEMDYSDEKGIEFYGKYKLTLLPALLFEKNVKEAENFKDVERYLKETEDLYSLNIGARHNPAKEICDNNTDDTANSLTDCDDPDCQGFLGCRAEEKGRLDVFVMSQCPYGTKALDAMKEVLENFGSQFVFHINYIASENPDGTFESLHGQEEVDENIRELCAIKHYPENHMDYIWCRNKDITGDYTACAKNFPKIKNCSEGDEGKKLLSENIKLAESLGIGASPTWLANNRYEFNGIDAETVKTNFCQYNSEIAGCDNILSSISAGGDVPAGSCN